MYTISRGINAQDRASIENILRSTEFFYEFEINTALEIADATISKGEEGSGYLWMNIIDEDGFVAFANYAKNDFSTHSWDIFWLAVHQNSRNKKLGSLLLKAVEDDIWKRDGKIIWIETSGRPFYASTEAFYRKKGYTLQASLKDFYADGDPKQIYSKDRSIK